MQPELNMIEDFESKIRDTIEYLPPIPLVMTELIQALSDDIDLNDLGKIISKDPSMSMNVLKVANSAFYGLRNKVATIEHAVRMLGTREITSLCIACSACSVLKPASRKSTIDLTLFWRHSVATGVFSKLLSSELNIGLLNNIYLAGLIHDVPHLDIRHEQQIRLPGHGVADRLVAGRLARERTVDRERPGDDAARNPAPRHLARRHSRGHLLRDGFDRGQNRHLRR